MDDAANDGNVDRTNRLPPPPPPPPRAPHAHHNPPPPRGGDPTPPAVTSIVRGVVTSVRPFGVFVRPVGKARDGLVHCTQVSEELTFTREDSDDAKQMAMEYFFPKGTEVWVKVLDVTVEGGAGTGGYADPSTLGLGDPPAFRDPPRPVRNAQKEKVSLSIKAVDQETGEDLDPSHAACFGARERKGFDPVRRDSDGDQNSQKPPSLSSIIRAVVRAVKPYGVFVRPEGKSRDALVPSHQVSEHLRFDKEDDDDARVAGLEGVVSVGDSVFAKIVEIREDPFDAAKPPRVTASMKLCDQTSGEDLDPEGVKYRPSGDRGENDAGAGRDRRVGAGAGDRVRAGGVIDWGHHAGDVKQMRMPDEQGTHGDGAGARYDLIEDDPEADRVLLGARFDGRGPDGRAPPPPPPGGPPRGGGGAFEVPPPPGGPPLVGSVEEALAILAKHKREKKARKADKKARKKARKKEKKSSKSKSRRRSRSSSSSGSSESDDESDERARRRKRERR